MNLFGLINYLKNCKFGDVTKMTLICKKQVALHISYNPVFHEKIKHIVIDCHFLWEKILVGDIKTKFIYSNDQLVDIFIKSLRRSIIDYICNKLGTYDLEAPAWGRVLDIVRYNVICINHEIGLAYIFCMIFYSKYIILCVFYTRELILYQVFNPFTQTRRRGCRGDIPSSHAPCNSLKKLPSILIRGLGLIIKLLLA